MANNRKWSCKLADLQQRVAELELIVAQRHKPPSKLRNGDPVFGGKSGCDRGHNLPGLYLPAGAQLAGGRSAFDEHRGFSGTKLLYGGGWRGRWEARKFDHRCDPHVPSLRYSVG